jgi:hypothetical protein
MEQGKGSRKYLAVKLNAKVFDTSLSSEDIYYIYHWLSQQKIKIKDGLLSNQRIVLLKSIELAEKIQNLDASEISYIDAVWQTNYNIIKRFMESNHRLPYTD